MSEYDVKRFALVLAIQAEIEAMKIYNLKNPDNVGHEAHEFQGKAEELRNLAAKHNDQL